MSAHIDLLKSLSESPCFACSYYHDCSLEQRRLFGKIVTINAHLAQARLGGAISMAQLNRAAAQLLAKNKGTAHEPCRKSPAHIVPIRTMASLYCTEAI